MAGPDNNILSLDIAPNWRLFGATTLMVVVITLLFGIVPALRAAATAPGALANSGRVAESHGRLSSALIVAQVSLSLVLVIGAGLFARTLYNLRNVDRGFVPGNVLLVKTDPGRLGLTSPQLQAFNREILAGIEQLPGVGAASMSVITPLQGGGMSAPITVNGVSTGLDEVYWNMVAPRFFEIVGTPLLAGRDFNAGDDASGEPVAIVNEAFARRYLEGLLPLGQRVQLPGTDREMRIVGVVKDAVYESLWVAPPPTVYASYLQTRGRPMTLVIDARAPIADVSAAVRAEVQPKVPASPIIIRTFRWQIENSLFEARLMMGLTMIFGGLAVLLAAIGLYGLMSVHGCDAHPRDRRAACAWRAAVARAADGARQRIAHGGDRDHRRSADRVAVVAAGRKHGLRLGADRHDDHRHRRCRAGPRWRGLSGLARSQSGDAESRYSDTR